MKFYLISDDKDALTGMHLAGIPGEYVLSAEDAAQALQRALTMEDIGILLITDSIAAKCSALVSEIKLNTNTPLLIEIPNSDGSSRTGNSIMKIVHDAIGM